MAESKNKRKTRSGIVISDKMNKSIVVRTDMLVKHKLYDKYIRRRNKFMVHDEEDICKIGDRVLIEECRPLSKRKRWRLLKVTEEAV
ncbi:MAG: 30S ribosomal protein S17 [Thermodesulfobacteriota bacterium]